MSVCPQVNTCAIRENAEQKVWTRLDYFKSLKRAAKTRNKHMAYPEPLPVVGVLGTLLVCLFACVLLFLVG
jgi:hypothetical protein